MSELPPGLARLPMVGRSSELARLRSTLEGVRGGTGRVVLVSGEGGVGKSRLVALMADEARHGGWTVAQGRAYPVESGVPYALLSDAFVPLLRGLGDDALTVLTRGAGGRLAQLFPALGSGTGAPTGEGAAANVTELFWAFAELLRRLSERAPLLVVLEDLHWADLSSVELFHFLARQTTSCPVAFVATVNVAERQGHPTLQATERSLYGLGVLEKHALDPLPEEGTAELVRHAFGQDEAVTRDFTALLWGWTRGNPFFVEETLKALVASGRLRPEGGGWLGWEMQALELPGTVRDAVRVRLDRLTPVARQVAEVAAVVGTRADYRTLRSVTGLPEPELVDALEELRRSNVLAEEGEPSRPTYDFVHPILRQTLEGDLGLARRRMLHARIAEVLEAAYGEAALDHADELARHHLLGTGGEVSGKAVLYMMAAGRAALARFADREAAAHLSAVLDRLDGEGSDDVPARVRQERPRVLEDLARARQRLGEFEEAVALRRRLVADAAASDRPTVVVATLRRIGLAHFWAGRHQEAMDACREALAAAATAGLEPPAARIRLVLAACLQAVGRVDEAREELEAALTGTEREDDPELLARVHRALLIFHTLSGPPERARAHGARAIELAEGSDNRVLACTCHWAMAVLQGFTGRSGACSRHLDTSAALADALHSPLLRLQVDDVAVQHAYSLGEWDRGVALGERAIALGRSLNQRRLLPRLLVWTAFIYIGRHQLERARRYLDEAWQLAGAREGGTGRHADVHSVVPAHVGLAAWHLARGDFGEAVRIGQEGLALVERTGYTAWAVHRLLPVVAEAQLFRGDIPGAAETGARLRRDAEALDHPLGVAWADTCDAVLACLQGELERGIGLLQAAAAKLESVPYVPDAARLRRQLALRLAEVGDREGAIHELRTVHDVFVKLGAEKELEKTRSQFHELDARPPVRSAGGGTEALTGREVEIVRLVAERKSNKAIGKALGISPRTVGTHLSNIYGKLEIGSRAELTALAPVILSVEG